MKTAHRLVTATVLLAPAAAGVAGPITPPSGPVGPTYRTLEQVEPRRPVQSLPGDGQAMYVISQPGSYYLTGNITGVSGKCGIMITCGGVTLDLSGFSVVGVPGATSGIWCPVMEVKNNAVLNGSVQDWPQVGVWLSACANNRVERLRISDCGLAGMGIGPHSTVWGCEVSSCDGVGIAADSRLVMSDTVIDFNGEDGLLATGEMCSLSNVTSSYNGASGIHIGESARLSGCIASHNGGSGIWVRIGSVLDACTGWANGDAGAVIGDGCTITDGSFSNNDGPGIRAASGCTIARNTCRENVGDGIVATNSNQITGNTCDNNGYGGAVSAGVHVTGLANRVDGNAVIAGDVGIDVDSAGNFVVRNSVTFCPTRHTIAAGNTVGQWIINPGGSFTSSDPWANFGY